MTEHRDACLHCLIWKVINQFCDDYPDGYVHDVLMALADVIGDVLATQPTSRRDEFIRDINEDILKRIEFVREEMRKEKAHG